MVSREGAGEKAPILVLLFAGAGTCWFVCRSGGRPAGGRPFGKLTCLNSTNGFNSSLQPEPGGTVWTDDTHGVASIQGGGFISEYDVGLITNVVRGTAVSLGAWSATVGYNTTLSGPNSDGSYAYTITNYSGMLTSGPHNGKGITATTVSTKVWQAGTDVTIQTYSAPVTIGAVWAGNFVSATNLTPVVQTVTLGLSKEFTYSRVCGVNGAVMVLP